MSIVIILKRIQLPFQIRGIPKQDMVEILAPDRPDQSLYKGMRNRHVGYRFDLLDAEDPQVGPPSVERKQRIVIGAEIPRDADARYGRLNIRQRSGPSTSPAVTANPMMRRVN